MGKNDGLVIALVAAGALLYLNSGQGKNNPLDDLLSALGMTGGGGNSIGITLPGAGGGGGGGGIDLSPLTDATKSLLDAVTNAWQGVVGFGGRTTDTSTGGGGGGGSPTIPTLPTNPANSLWGFLNNALGTFNNLGPTVKAIGEGAQTAAVGAGILGGAYLGTRYGGPLVTGVSKGIGAVTEGGGNLLGGGFNKLASLFKRGGGSELGMFAIVGAPPSQPGNALAGIPVIGIDWWNNLFNRQPAAAPVLNAYSPEIYKYQQKVGVFAQAPAYTGGNAQYLNTRTAQTPNPPAYTGGNAQYVNRGIIRATTPAPALAPNPYARIDRHNIV
jgi:hypothetical protein